MELHRSMKGKNVSHFTICLPEKSPNLVVEFLVLRNTKLTVFIPIYIYALYIVCRNEEITFVSGRGCLL